MRHHDGVTVGRRFRDDLGSELAAGAAAIVDHDLLTEGLAQFMRDDAADDVGAAAGRKADDHPYRFRRIRLSVSCCYRYARGSQREREAKSFCMTTSPAVSAIIGRDRLHACDSLHGTSTLY